MSPTQTAPERGAATPASSLTRWEGEGNCECADCVFLCQVYHIGSHLPGWFKSLLPASALTVEERAWNAYPYTKTVFSCPFVEKFNLEIETFYLPG